MPGYSCTAGYMRYQFPDLKTLLARASPVRSGDSLAGIAASNPEERVAAQMALSEVPLDRFLEQPLIPYEQDEVTRLNLDTHDAMAFRPVSGLTVGEFRNWLLAYETTAERLAALAPGLTPEMVAGQQRGRLHRARIPLRRQADHPGRAGGSLLRETAGRAMGCDACYTNHAEADQNDMDTLLTLWAWPAATTLWACRALPT